MKKYLLILIMTLLTVVKSYAWNPEAPKPYYPVSFRGVYADGNNIWANSWEEVNKLKFHDFQKIIISTMDKNKEMDSALLYTLFIECTRLEELEIYDFRLSAFPVITQKNDNIKKLILKNNNISQMPESIGQLVALEELSITNPIVELPSSFENMKALKYLEINYAEFTSFPTLIFELTQLEKLTFNFYTSHAKITTLPDQFDRLKHLQEFTFDYAAIASLPKSFTTLSKLSNVSLTNNKFNTFPPELHALPSLSYVSLIGNPLDWKLFYPSIKKIKWRGLFAIYDTNLTPEQYKTVEKTLKKMDVYYE